MTTTLDKIGFDSMVNNKGATFTFATLKHVSAPYDDILIHATNIATFDDGYFVSVAAWASILNNEFTLEEFNSRIQAIMQWIDKATEFLGIWQSPLNNVWMIDASKHYESLEDAMIIARANGQSHIYDVKNNRSVPTHV